MRDTSRGSRRSACGAVQGFFKACLFASVPKRLKTLWTAEAASITALVQGMEDSVSIQTAAAMPVAIRVAKGPSTSPLPSPLPLLSSLSCSECCLAAPGPATAPSQVSIPIAVVVQHTVITREQHRTSRTVVTSPQQQRKKCTNRAWMGVFIVLAVTLMIVAAVNSSPGRQSS